MKLRKWLGCVRAASASLLLQASIPSVSRAEEASRTEEILFSDLSVTIASLLSQLASEAPSVVTVVTAQEIKDSGARNLEDVLRNVAGFDTVQFGTHIDALVSVRGLSSTSDNNKIKLMMNGHSLSSFSGGPLYYFNSIPLETIKQIEIIRGPGSALYGANAFLGVVNIITKDSLDSTARATARGGSESTFKPTVEVAKNTGNVRLYAYADYFDTKGPELNVEQDAVWKPPFNAPAQSAAPGKTASNNTTTTFQTRMGYKNLSFQGFYTRLFDTNSHIGLARALGDESTNNSQAYFGELSYTQSFSDRAKWVTKAYYDMWRYLAIFEVFSEQRAATIPAGPSGTFPSGEGMYGSPRGDYTTVGAETTISFKPWESLDVVAGGLSERIKFTNLSQYANFNGTGVNLTLNGNTYLPNRYIGGFMDIKNLWNESNPRSVLAGYGQATLDIKKAFGMGSGVETLSLTSGARYDDYSDVGYAVSPRAGLVYAPSSDVYFKLLYGTAFRAPSFRELYNVRNSAFIGNRSLKPERLSTWEVVVGGDVGAKAKTSLTYFNTRIRDGVVQQGSSPTNVGRVVSQGVEWEGRWDMARRRSLFANATYQNSLTEYTITATNGSGVTFNNGEFNPGYFASLMGNVGGNTPITRHISANATLNYVGKRPRTGEYRFTGSSALKYDTRAPMDARTLANLAVTVGSFESIDGLEFQLACFNAFNENHRDPDPGSNAYINDIPRSGRTFLVKASLSF